MASVIRSTGIFLALLGTVAIGAPNDDGALVDKQVFPLVKEDEQWWAGVQDVCALMGAEFEGEGLSLDVDREHGIRIRALVRIGGEGPFRIKVADDVYEFRLNQLAITRNGEDFGDLLFAPKRIEGVVSASLEDLARLLHFEIGREVEGQPTVHKDDKHYRLVKGERPLPSAAFKEAEKIFQVNPENWQEWRERLEKAPFDWRKIPHLPRGRIIFPGGFGAGYAEHNGLLYYRGGVGLQVGPELLPPAPGATETLYGPVLPNRFQAEGRSGDLTYLSIVERRAPTGSFVWMMPPGRP